jgi:NadR type nicotinamide-nucleotide adenylyltransferase
MADSVGLVLGKFLPYHAGHAHLIHRARAQVDQLTVLACSIAREPIAGALRYRWVRDSHPDCHVVHVAEEVPQAPEEHPDFWPIWLDLIRRHAGPIDVAFTSEEYGDELAARIGARHVCIDRERTAVPVSGTAIRTDPMGNWSFIPPVVRPYFARRIAILGAESSGKTTLAQQLARRFDTAWVPEYGRPYCDHRPALELRLPDFEAIAWGQATWEDEHAQRANRVLVCDTELHTTASWSELVTGARPPWLDAAASARQYDLMLLLDADVPWEDDGTRVLRDRRAEHTQLLRRTLDAAGRRYEILSGSFAERQAAAERLVERVLAG